MSISKPQRGRPKGSGIDDRAILIEVAQRMHADPQLKATTAIKSLGFADPSIIRRLRDKFRHVEAELRLELSARAANDTGAAPNRPKAEVGSNAPAVIACGQALPRSDLLAEPIVRREDARAAQAADDIGGHDKTASDAGTISHGLLACLTLGIAAFDAALQAQQLATQQLFKLPQFAALLRQTIVLNEMGMALCGPKRDFALH